VLAKDWRRGEAANAGIFEKGVTRESVGSETKHNKKLTGRRGKMGSRRMKAGKEQVLGAGETDKKRGHRECKIQWKWGARRYVLMSAKLNKENDRRENPGLR